MGKTFKRGEKQLIVLRIMNSLPENYRLEDLSGAVARDCELSEDAARHTIKYIVRYQDRLDERGGKTVTLREQGRIIEPSWYTPVPNTTERDSKGNLILYKDFPLKKPTTRKTPEKTEAVAKPKAPVVSKKKEMSPERLEAFRAAQKSVSAKKATKVIEELAKAGAHHFTAPEIVRIETTETETASAKEEV